jgi:hypothetical protein
VHPKSVRSGWLDRRRRFTRLGVAAAAAMAGLVVSAGPASAASAPEKSPEAQYYRSSVISVEPATSGLKVTVLANGQSVTLENRSGKEVVVLGYAGEPYLRFTDKGVDENTTALSSQLNADQTPQVQQDKPVVTWTHRTDELRYSWRDFRVQWTTQQRPPIVAQDEHAQHRVFDWALPLTVEGQPALVRGAVDWVGIPRFGTGTFVLVGAGALVVLGAGAAFWFSRRRAGGRRGGPHAHQDVEEREPAMVGASTDDPYAVYRSGSPTTGSNDLSRRSARRHR